MSLQLFLIVLLVIGVIIFMTGLHGIDNAWNLAYVEKSTGIEWFDQTLFGHGMSPGEMYNQSLYMTIVGFIISVVSAVSIFGRNA